MMLKLKLQYLGRLMWRVESLEKSLMMGGIGGRRRRGWQRMRWLDGITDSVDMGLGRLRKLVIESPGVLRFMGSQRVGHDWATELNWTEVRCIYANKFNPPLVYISISFYAALFVFFCHSLFKKSILFDMCSYFHFLVISAWNIILHHSIFSFCR